MNSVLGGGLKYYYGGRNASHNRIGRLMMREDGTGAIEYFYGKMGEVTKTRRTLIVPNQAIATYVTQWTYDSHNRLTEMIYPDEEKVTYSYNLGGQLEKVRGEKSYGYDYITKLGYDKFEQRSYLKYCNGAETFYTYDNRRRLSNLAVNSGNTAIMDNDYTFDAVSNVLSVANNASLPASGNAGGKMSHTYTYDGLYRLVSATGTYTGADSKSASYTLAMGYDNMHRITSKSQHLTQDNVQFNGTLSVGYDLTYTYGTEDGKKFQLASVKDVNYRTENTPGDNNIENNHVYLYDKNGNLIYVNTGRLMDDGHNETGTGERKLIWDEENRLLAVDDNGFVSNYWYDADGERTVKTSGESDQVYVNGVFSGGSTNTAKFSLYVSPYLVANQGGRYTKHIYAGSQRIVSKIGDFASYGSDPRRIEYAGANTDGLSVDYKAKYAAQQQVIKDNYKTFDVPYNGTDNDNYADGEGFCCNDGSMEAAMARTKAQARAVARSFKDPDNYENLQFFYHPDHLGSSSFITNLEGEVVQHIEYVPFGEVFIEERNNVWNTPYLFNAKEFDEETGMYYYGARYYEPRLSLWMSADPIREKYPNISSYCYVTNNPVNAYDPDGKLVIFINGFYVTPTEGGDKSYWRSYKNWHFSFSVYPVRYRREKIYEFDIDVMNHLKDTKAKYVDGSLGGAIGILGKNMSTAAEVRRQNGEIIGLIDAPAIIANLNRDKDGNITEHIKVITHSMGSAYAKGYISSILKYADDNGIKGVIIDFEADFAPYNTQNQKAISHPNMGPTYQFSHSQDKVAGNKQITGAKMMDTSSDANQAHSIGSFVPQIQNIPVNIHSPKKK